MLVIFTISYFECMQYVQLQIINHKCFALRVKSIQPNQQFNFNQNIK